MNMYIYKITLNRVLDAYIAKSEASYVYRDYMNGLQAGNEHLIISLCMYM